MKDIDYCLSSFLAFRYIYEDDKDFFENKHHINYVPCENKILVNSAKDIDEAIKQQIEKIKNNKIGVLLSGGMDSAIVASYVPGAEAYTFRFLGGAFQQEELKKAEYYAKYYHLNLHYVDITWDTVKKHLDPLLERKCAPVHSIEPQILQAALQAKKDGCEIILIGEHSDIVFGGMDKLLSKDWTVEDFQNRYMYVNPKDVLKKPIPLNYIFEKYRTVENKMDFLRFMNDVYAIESPGSYLNAFEVANIQYLDPYARLKLKQNLDLNRIRKGESKYLIRELMQQRYPEIPVPNKTPMPRPVDEYFKDWKGPTRPEFIPNLDMKKFTGNQKWLIWCLEYFLNKYNF